jgi:hypothetical protein
MPVAPRFPVAPCSPVAPVGPAGPAGPVQLCSAAVVLSCDAHPAAIAAITASSSGFLTIVASIEFFKVCPRLIGAILIATYADAAAASVR